MKLLAKPRTQKWLREFVHSQEFAKSCWYYVKRYKLLEYVASSCNASIERVLIQYAAADEYSPEIIHNVIVYSNVNNDVVNDAAVIQFLRAVTQRFITDARDQVLLHILQGKQSAIPTIVSVGIITPIVEHYYYARHDPTRAIDEFLLKLLALARQSYDRSTRRDTEWFICGMKFLKYRLTEAEHRDGVFELLRTSIGEDYKRSCELLLWTTLKELADEGGLVLSLSLSLSLYWATYAPLYLIVERICVPERAFSTLSRALLSITEPGTLTIGAWESIDRHVRDILRGRAPIEIVAPIVRPTVESLRVEETILTCCFHQFRRLRSVLPPSPLLAYMTSVLVAPPKLETSLALEGASVSSAHILRVMNAANSSETIDEILIDGAEGLDFHSILRSLPQPTTEHEFCATLHRGLQELRETVDIMGFTELETKSQEWCDARRAPRLLDFLAARSSVRELVTLVNQPLQQDSPAPLDSGCQDAAPNAQEPNSLYELLKHTTNYTNGKEYCEFELTLTQKFPRVFPRGIRKDIVVAISNYLCNFGAHPTNVFTFLSCAHSVDSIKALVAPADIVLDVLRTSGAQSLEAESQSIVVALCIVIENLVPNEIGALHSEEAFCVAVDCLATRIRDEVTSVVNPESMTVERLRSAAALRHQLNMRPALVDLDAKYENMMQRHIALIRLCAFLLENSPLSVWIEKHLGSLPTVDNSKLLRDAEVVYYPLLLEVGDAMHLLDRIFVHAANDKETFAKHTWRLDPPQSGEPLAAILQLLLVSLEKSTAPSTASPAQLTYADAAASSLQTPEKRSQPKFPRCKVADVACHELIGDGTTCYVYRATWRGGACAFKKYRRSVSREIGREMDVAPFLQHDFTVRVFAIVEENSKPIGLLMELCEDTLGAAIAADFLPARTVALRWLHEVAQAVDFAHSCHVVHSDIKPENILLHGTSGKQHAKLADFGSSFVLSTLATVSTNARGTPLFMAPEYAEGDTGPTPAADIFSFGMTMWFALCPSGTPHGLGQHTRHIERALLNGKRPPLAGIEPKLSKLIEQCWHQDPSQRPPAIEIADTLRIVCDSTEVAVTPTPVFSPTAELWEGILVHANLAAPHRALQWQETENCDFLLSSPLATPGEPCFEFLVSQLDPNFSRKRVSHFAMVGLGSSTVSAFMTQHRAEARTRAVNANLRIPNDAKAFAAVERLKQEFLPIEKSELNTSRIALVWHGTWADNVVDICRDGPRSLRTTDSGFFGAGSYFALEASYAALFPKGSRVRAMVLFAVSVSQAKVITVDDDYRLIEDDRTPHLHGFSNFYSGDPQRAVALAPKYDAHFIPVKHYGFTHPRTKRVTSTDMDYQAVDECEATAHELVIASYHRCVPIAVMYFT